MRTIKEILDELWLMELPAKLPVDDMVNLAVQIQRNEILENGFSDTGILDLVATLESLKGNIHSLELTIRSLKDSIEEKK